ncbi:MAG: hypothetical protein ACK52H_09805 [Burkholderiales bacterium]|jgi:hypothetical protein
MVGDGNDPVQVRAIRQIETLADRDEIRARLEPSAQLAAQRVASMKRLAA